MKRLTIIFVVCVILLMTIGIVFAETNIEKSEKIKEKMIKEGIIVNDINQIDYNNLPPEMKIVDIGDTDLAIYKVDQKNNKPIFVITSGEKFQTPSVKPTYSRTFLDFGFNGDMNESGFLKTSTGVEGGLNKGYVMINKGSITGISTNLDVLNSKDSGKIEIIIYKNGEQIGFGNSLNAASSGIKKDYDIQSENTVIFEPGDIISVYAKSQKNIIWSDVTTMVEITFVK